MLVSAKVLVLDIETQRAVVETFSIWKPFIGIDRVIMDARILCFAAKWRGEDKVIFHAAWDDDDEDAYLKMLKSAYSLLDEADIVVTFNGDRFDLQWLEERFARHGLGRPTPYKSVDLRKTQKRKFGAGLLSGKLDWTVRQWFKDSKVKHGGSDLWADIRYGSRDQRRAAQKLMKEYNKHDVVLTEQVFDAYLPWLNVNLAVYYQADDDGLLHCTKCESTSLKRDGKKYHATSAALYQMFRCKDCGSTSRGPRAVGTTALRPVG